MTMSATPCTCGSPVPFPCEKHGTDGRAEIDRLRAENERLHAALSTPAGPSPSTCECCERKTVEPITDPESGSDFCGRCAVELAVATAAPSPREGAVEAAAKALAREFGMEGVFNDGPGEGTGADHWRRIATVALSAARPSSPTPEETWKDEAAFPHLSGYAARSATPGDDATTKEGR